jgi:hypothetical protein
MVTKVELTSLHSHQDIFVVLSSEGWLSTKHDIKDDSDAPHIAHVSILALQNLRGNVIGGSINLVHVLVVVVKHLRCSEIDNLYSSLLLGVNQYVLWLEISVSNFLGVTVANG